MPSVITVVCISNSVSFLGKNITHLHRDIHNNILDFVQDTGVFVSLSWTLINNLCSPRLWGLCHEYASLINLASVRLRHLKTWGFISTLRAYTLNINVRVPQPSLSHTSLWHFRKNRIQHGISNITTRLSLKLSRDQDETRGQMKRGTESSASPGIPVPARDTLPY